MATLTDMIPESTAKKVGKALFVTHKSKIDAVMAASKATDSELRDPEKLKEWFGVPDGKSVGTKTVDVKTFRRKFKLTITMVDYTKISNALDKGNKWFETLSKLNPVPEVNKRKKAAEKNFILFGKSVYHNGEDGEETIKLAEKAYPPILDLSVELVDLHGYYVACKSVFPKHQKVFEEYDKLFRDARDVFDKLLSNIPLPPAIQADLFVHYQECEKLSSKCKTARDLCKKIAANATKNEKAVKGYRMMMQVWLGQLGKTLLPAKIKEGVKAAEAAARPLMNMFKKTFGS